MANTPARFSIKSVNLLVKAQSAIGTPASLIASDVIACTDLTYDTNVTTDEDTFIGDVKERYSLTTVKDRTTSIKVTTLFPRLGTVSGTPTAANVSFATLFNICNAGITLSGSSGTAKAVISNAVVAPTVATIGFVRTSVDLSTDGTWKKYLSTDCYATADLSIEAGGKAKISFNIMGNFANPVMESALTINSAAYGNQKINYAYNVKKSTIGLCELYPTPWSATGTSNLCFYKLNGTNIFGQEITRNLSGCAEEFDRQATQGDLTITIKEDAADVGIEWYSQIEKYFGFVLAWSDSTPNPTVAGTLTKFKVSNMQLVDVKQTSSGNRATFDLVFKIVGDTSIELDSSLTRGT